MKLRHIAGGDFMKVNRARLIWLVLSTGSCKDTINFHILDLELCTVGVSDDNGIPQLTS